MEIIRFGVPSEKPPLLFVHGSYCGAWIWERFFLPAFAKEGWSGAALSLRGHGKSEGIENINAFGVAAFLEDVEEGVKLFDKEPVLIGHSLGGYLIQKFALDHKVRGLALLSSPSLWGLCGPAQHIALNNPLLGVELGKLMTYGPKDVDGDVISKAFFNDPQAAKEMEDLLPLLQKESARLSLEACWPEWRRPKEAVPTFVLGGDKDAFVPTFDFKYEASFWNGELHILPGVSHGVMLDSCWPAVSKEIMDWLARTFCA
jgi:pimeloyl-ACP methyl ester carboxylesterase